MFTVTKLTFTLVKLTFAIGTLGTNLASMSNKLASNFMSSPIKCVSLYPIKQLVGLSLAPRAYEESPGNIEHPTS